MAVRKSGHRSKSKKAAHRSLSKKKCLKSRGKVWRKHVGCVKKGSKKSKKGSKSRRRSPKKSKRTSRKRRSMRGGASCGGVDAGEEGGMMY